jgi:hypothetical protein
LLNNVIHIIWYIVLPPSRINWCVVSTNVFLQNNPYTIKNLSNNARTWKIKLRSSPTFPPLPRRLPELGPGTGRRRTRRGGGGRSRACGCVRRRSLVSRHRAGGQRLDLSRRAHHGAGLPSSTTARAVERDAEADLRLSSLTAPLPRRPQPPSHAMHATAAPLPAELPSRASLSVWFTRAALLECAKARTGWIYNLQEQINSSEYGYCTLFLHDTKSAWKSPWRSMQKWSMQYPRQNLCRKLEVAVSMKSYMLQ